ncbi:MAG: hypothetical protein Q9195_008127 [Heterodermia aff. obscurata]
MGSKPSAPASRETTPAPVSANHQDLLLSLLNRPSPSQPAASKDNNASKSTLHETNIGAVTQNLANSTLDEQGRAGSAVKDKLPTARHESPIRVFGSHAEQPSPFEPQHMPKADSQPKKDSMFTYVNPFEQLAASSPRNIQSKTANIGDHKRKSKEPSPGPIHANSRRKITPASEEILQSIESPAPPPLDDGRTQIEALIGIGAPTQNTETVAEALNEVGGQVNREAQSALAEAEARADEKEKQADLKKEEFERAQEETIAAMAENAHDTAVQVKQELDKEENKGLLEETLTTPVAEVVKEIIDDAAQGDAPDAWESADGVESHTKDESEQTVKVYQFPMRPFVSITVTPSSQPSVDIRSDSVLDIARLKKDFDQIDRTLATATTEFITYSIVKPGGIRIIRQDDGADQHIFSGSKDRMFNLCISVAHGNSPLRGIQNVIATGISGSVYWATIARADGMPFDTSYMEAKGLIIPPSASQTESTSSGQLKTRAKKSSRHPQFFAIGRGKLIHIIFPVHALSSKFVNPESSVLDTDGYFQDRTLKISTGKAGKDFTFSEDDTAIITLDKAGRLRFWDVTELIDESNGTASRLAGIDVKTPLHSLATTHHSQKSWPTSVLFLDKLKAYQRGIAQRYVLVGMKQNHTLQLWDLGLGKAVQELHFPHEKEDDPICSIAYHPASGIIVVGHPTRNSLYFVHLSAPRYSIPSMSQAAYLKKVFNNDASIPKTELTAIMSGLREYSFASKGQIRSVDLVPTAGDSAKALDDDDDPPLFELYITHSRGVTCLNIKKQDLGWSKDSKVLHPVNAEQVGEIAVKDLSPLASGSVSDSKQSNGDSAPSQQHPVTPKSSQKSKTDVSKNASISTVKEGDAQQQAQQIPSAIPDHAVQETPASEKAEKKKKKKRGIANEDRLNAPEIQVSTDAADEPLADTVEPIRSSETGRGSLRGASRDDPTAGQAPEADRPQKFANSESINLGISGDFLDKELKKIETGVAREFSRALGKELDNLYRRIDDDKRVQDAAGSAKQDAMLRLISSTLTGNVDKALARIVEANMKQSVVPAIADVVASSLDRKLSETLSQQLHHTVPIFLKATVPDAVGRSMQSPEMLRILSDQVTSKITGHVEKEFLSVLHNNISPSFRNLAINVAQKTSSDVESRVREHLQLAELQQRKDAAKIDELTLLVRSLSETVHTMAAAQSEFQQEILKLQSQAAQERQAISIQETSRHHQGKSNSSAETPNNSMTPEQAELNAISSMMSERRYEEAVIQWLQSNEKDSIFDNYLARLNPGFIQQLSPLITLSVGAAVTNLLENNVMERLAWLEVVFANIDPRDSEIREVAPRIIPVLGSRLESQYMRTAEANPRDLSLRRIPPLARSARELVAIAEQ